MPTTRADLDAFHHFAVQQRSSGQDSLELDELLLKWCDQQQQGSIDEILQQGLKNFAAGLGVPAWKATEELRRKHGR